MAGTKFSFFINKIVRLHAASCSRIQLHTNLEYRLLYHETFSTIKFIREVLPENALYIYDGIDCIAFRPAENNLQNTYVHVTHSSRRYGCPMRQTIESSEKNVSPHDQYEIQINNTGTLICDPVALGLPNIAPSHAQLRRPSGVKQASSPPPDPQRGGASWD